MKYAVASLLVFAIGCGGKSGGGDGPDAGSGGDDAPVDIDAPPGPACGDGVLDVGEACDDHNTDPGDGCAADCSAIEDYYACPTPGQSCEVTFHCGNGIVEDPEGCDDHNTANGDGCDQDCVVETGWLCAIPGIRCGAAQCGDGIIAGFEECDDGGAATPGCSDTCTLEPGYQCPAANAPCTPTACGDGVAQGTEQCDDGNNDLGDGCTPQCTREPVCIDGTCTAVCGDGVLQAGEQCDDGNLRSFDGCSAACVEEVGFTCVPSTTQEPDTLYVPIVYRDFKGADLDGGHVDFQNINESQDGMTTSTLVNNKPYLIDADDYGAAHTSIKNRDTFDQWYRDGALAKTVVATLPMTRTAPGTYVFDDQTFFPVDGLGWQDASVPVDDREISRDDGHNFSFTSELRYWFKWQGTEELHFRGDDDVWVFVNGKLAVDIGGVHGARDGDITLDAATNVDLGLGLTLGGTYEVVVFQAERHTTASSYKLTLKGFNTQQSVCDDTCGDGETSSYEACDDGVNDGSYNSCTATCEFGPRCGDGELQADHEQCDDGTALNTGGYGKCSPTCQLGPRCGDGVLQAGEACDDGNTDDGDACPANCQTIIQ